MIITGTTVPRGTIGAHGRHPGIHPQLDHPAAAGPRRSLHWPQLTRVQVTYRGAFGYVTGVLGIHVNIRLEEHKLCLLVMIGVRAGWPQGAHRADRWLLYRELTESWADLLRDCKRRGMRAPVLAAGDGALVFWGALREAFPQAREQRCWFHKIANVLGVLPKSAHPGAKKHLAEIWNAEDAEHARRAVKEFEAAYGEFPAEHWIHLRTTNPTPSPPCGTRPRSPRGPARAAALAMAFKLIESAQARWPAVNAPHLVALVRAGARFERGVLVEREDQAASVTASVSGACVTPSPRTSSPAPREARPHRAADGPRPSPGHPCSPHARSRADHQDLLQHGVAGTADSTAPRGHVRSGPHGDAGAGRGPESASTKEPATPRSAPRQHRYSTPGSSSTTLRNGSQMARRGTRSSAA